MMDAVTISIVLPLYNGARYIRETLAALEAQTYADAELVVVNDGSTDESPALIEQYCSRSRSPILRRLTLLNRTNSGVAVARNCGIAAASGMWIALLDQDDLWHAEKLAHLQAAVNERPNLAWYYSDFKRFYDDGREVCKQNGSSDRVTTLSRLVDGTLFIPPSAGCIRKDVCRAVGGFDATVIPSDDWDFYLKLAERYDVGYVPEFLVKFRSHAASTAKRQKLMIFTAQREVLQRHEQILLKDIDRRLIRKRMANIEWHLGKEYEQDGNKKTAQNHYRRAWKLDPFRIKLLSSYLKSYI